MLMVVLGAGASYDSVSQENIDDRTSDRHAWRPPLTKTLFSDPRYIPILNEFPAVQGLVEAIRHSLRSSGGATTVEAELRRCLDEARTDPTRHRELVAARFYIQWVIARCSQEWSQRFGGVTNQAWLVRTLEFWRRNTRPSDKVLYVTFNYDDLLEQALEGQLGWDRAEPRGLQSYIDDPRFSLIKLHGSIDWGQHTAWLIPQVIRNITEPVARGGLIRRGLINEAGNYEISRPSQLLERSDGRVNPSNVMAVAGDQRVGTLPGLTIPLAEKSEFTCPTAHVEALKRDLPAVDRLISIGWRAAEPHVLELFQAIPKAARCWVISQNADSAGKIAETLSDALAIPGIEPVGSAGLSNFRENANLAAMLQ